MVWEALTWVGAALLAYVIGAIPTAYLVTRYIMGRDIRGLGDYNSGAANVFRSVGPRAGMGVGGIDIVKGAVAVLAVRLLADNTGMLMMAGFAVLAGHNWPVFLRFRGGRGAATSVGVLIAILPALALPIGALSLVILYYTKKAIFALALFLIGIPFLSWTAGYSPELIAYSFAVPVFIGFCHLFSTRIMATTERGTPGGAPASPE